MSDELTKAIAEVRLRQYGSEYSSDHLTWEDFTDEADEIAAALAPLIEARNVHREQRAFDRGYDKAMEGIEARVREARASAVPGPLYNRVMGLLLSHPLPDALYAAEDLKNAIGASAQRRAAREAEEVRRG